MSKHRREKAEGPADPDQETQERELPPAWQRIQGAIWLLGIAFLMYTGWWWPGILVLVAISGLTQGGLQLYLERKDKEQAQIEATQATQKPTQQQAAWLPSLCPNCGGPISAAAVRWTGTDTADCPYCSANIKKPA